MIPNPRNETTMHYALKCLGFIILRGLNCIYVTTEEKLISFANFYRTDDMKDINKFNGRSVVDVLGFYRQWDSDKKLYFGMRSIEAKATYEDFKAGYTQFGADYMYLIAPKGVIPKKKILPHYGLIEIDFDKIKDGCYKKRISYPVTQGNKEGWYYFSKRPKKIDVDNYQRFDVEKVLDHCAIRNTTEIQRMIETGMPSWLSDIKCKLDRPKEEPMTKKEIEQMKFIS